MTDGLISNQPRVETRLLTNGWIEQTITTVRDGIVHTLARNAFSIQDEQLKRVLRGLGWMSPEDTADLIAKLQRIKDHVDVEKNKPTSMLLWCPECGERHIDEGEFETKLHHTHACQNCGHCWRPAIVATRGVRFLPGFKNAEPQINLNEEHY